MTEKRRVRLGTVSRDVTPLGGGAFEIDGTRWTATADGAGAWRLRADGKAGGRAFVAGPSESPWVFFNGHVYHLEVTAAEAPARPRRDAAGELSAPMPATVRAVMVSVGEHVTVGQPLVILEAMKMELPVRAPHDGVVKTIACQPGELVQPGTPLLEMQ